MVVGKSQNINDVSDLKTNIDMELDTKETFSHFLKNDYPSIKPKENELRQAKIRFNQNKLSEERMIKILLQYDYKPQSFKAIPQTWNVDEDNLK